MIDVESVLKMMLNIYKRAALISCITHESPVLPSNANTIIMRVNLLDSTRDPVNQ